MKIPRTLQTALKLIIFPLAIAALAPVASAQVKKADNADNLNLTTSWFAGVVPGVGDIALWDSTVLAANTTLLGGNLSWQGIQITNPGGDVQINTGNALTLGLSGIDASTSSRNLLLLTNMTLGAAQTWNFTGTGTSHLIGSNGGSTTLTTGGNTVTINTGATAVTIGGNMAGAGGIIKNGNGTVSISGASTYNGTTTINAGVFQIGNSGAGGTIGSGGITGASGAALNFARTGTFTVANIISGGITVRQNNSGTTTLTGANTYTGPTALYGNGVLRVSTINSVGAGGSSNLGAPIDTAGGTLYFGNAAVGGQLTYTGAGETTDRVINLNGSTGGATIDQSGFSGLLKFTSPNTASGAGIKTLTLQGSTAGTGEIAGAIVDNSGTNKTSVNKAGTGTWTLSGVNTYTGNTTVSVGTLLVNTAVSGSNSGTGGGSVSVSATGTLGGSGQITPGTGNGISVASSGTIAPGAGIGTLTLNGVNTAATVLSLTSGATFAFELNVGLQSDKIALLNGATGDITFGGNAINFNDLSGGSLAPGAYTLFTATAVDNYGGSFAVDGSGFVTGGLSIGTGLGAYTGSTLQLVGNDIVLNLVPEPSTWVLIAGAGTFFMVMRRRRRD